VGFVGLIWVLACVPETLQPRGAGAAGAGVLAEGSPADKAGTKTGGLPGPTAIGRGAAARYQRFDMADEDDGKVEEEADGERGEDGGKAGEEGDEEDTCLEPAVALRHVAVDMDEPVTPGVS